MRDLWSQDELERLTKALENQHFPDRIDWVQVANDVRTRTPRMCRGKWVWECGKIGIGKRSYTIDWTEVEDKLLYKMRFEDFKPWEEIAPHFPGRTANQILAHSKTIRKHPPRGCLKKQPLPVPKVRRQKPAKFTKKHDKDEFTWDDGPLPNWEQIAADLGRLNDTAFLIKLPDLPDPSELE
jgi:hypothetical protein